VIKLGRSDRYMYIEGALAGLYSMSSEDL